MSVVDSIIKKALKKADVMVTVCTHRQIDIDVLESIMPLFSNKKHHYTWGPVRGDASIARSRSRAASHFLLNTDLDILLFIDDDIIFKEEDVTKLIDNVVSRKLICGGMYVQKETLDRTVALEDNQTIVFSKESKPEKVLAVSTGFMAIHREVLERMVKAVKPDGDPMFPLCHKDASWKFYPFFSFEPIKKADGNWIYGSEDWTFCLKAKQLGIDTWLDPSLFLGHKGEYVYDLRDRLRQPKVSWDKFDYAVN